MSSISDYYSFPDRTTVRRQSIRDRHKPAHARAAEAAVPVMGVTNRAPGVSIMGASSRTVDVMGGGDAGPRVSVMGAGDRGTRLDVFGESDLGFVDSLFTSARGDR